MRTLFGHLGHLRGHKQKGFTLIELLVVIAIIAILASIILASLNQARTKSRDARRTADLRQVENAIELYNNDNASYPAAADYAGLASYLVPQYISALPADPGSYSYTYEAETSSASTTSACSSAPCASYVIRAQLENNNTSILNGSITGTVGTIDCSHSTTYYFCARP